MNLITHIKKSLQDRRLNVQRNIAVERGDFLYYIVLEDTNERILSESIPRIYSSRTAAEEECEWNYEVISVTEYNEVFGGFME